MSRSTSELELLNELIKKRSIDLIHWVRQGIPWTVFNEISHSSPFSTQEWARYLNISERSLQRYAKDNRKLSPMQSDRVLRIMIILNRGEEVFEGATPFQNWLNQPCVALENTRPGDLLDTDFGLEMVSDTLGRIEFGVLS